MAFNFMSAVYFKKVIKSFGKKVRLFWTICDVSIEKHIKEDKDIYNMIID